MQLGSLQASRTHAAAAAHHLHAACAGLCLMLAAGSCMLMAASAAYAHTQVSCVEQKSYAHAVQQGHMIVTLWSLS